MLHIGRATEIGLLQNEQDVPVQSDAHVRNDARWHIGVDIDPRTRHQAFDDRSQFLGQRSHSFG
jgi:hypothetical protein